MNGRFGCVKRKKKNRFRSNEKTTFHFIIIFISIQSILGFLSNDDYFINESWSSEIIIVCRVLPPPPSLSFSEIVFIASWINPNKKDHVETPTNI
ncbi:hypothetical protein DERF_006084 [Dermatophagoides farinae]|uniref:Uncharacterized protein n=1 Tax=Dermatophagoides farinae TaxID=6954 RepID=A0A922L7U0_DERFA|nr:hypothetical protein DERF_006084 [Dermatophagoides farinae]